MSISWNAGPTASAGTQPSPGGSGSGITWNTSGASAALGHSQTIVDQTKTDSLASVHGNGQGLQPENPITTIGHATEGAFNQIGEGFNQANQSQSGGFMGGLGNMFAGVGKMVGGAAGVLGAPFAPLMRPAGDAIQKYADVASNDPGMQKFAMSPAGETTSHVAENVANYDSGLGAVVGFKAAPQAGEAAGEFGQRFVTTPEEAAARAHAEAAAKVPGVAKEWESPTVPGKSMNPQSFAKAREILQNTPTTPKFLAEHKLSPAQHTVGGKYATTETAEALRDTPGKLSRDMLRPSLQNADYTTAKIPVADLIKSTIEDLKKGKSETAGSIEAQTKNAEAEGAALARKYPEGMSLTELHDESIAYGKNGGFKSNGTVADNNTATMNRAFNRSLGESLSTKAPKDLPVAAFRKHLSQYYKGADYLDAINNKTAPVSLGNKLMRGGAGVVGGIIGHSIGGGIVGPAAGYLVGGALEHAFENMTLPMRDAALQNLKITNPEAYTKVAEFVGKRQADAATVLKLPPGKEAGSAENPHLQPPAELGTQLEPNIPREGTIEQLSEQHAGWQPGDKAKFDHALLHKDAATMQEMLPRVPNEYKQSFQADIEKIVGPQAGAPAAESTLSFIKNNIGKDQRGFLGFGGKASSAKAANVKSQINEALQRQSMLSREKPNGWLARSRKLEQQIAGLRKLL